MGGKDHFFFFLCSFVVFLFIAMVLIWMLLLVAVDELSNCPQYFFLELKRTKISFTFDLCDA